MSTFPPSRDRRGGSSNENRGVRARADGERDRSTGAPPHKGGAAGPHGEHASTQSPPGKLPSGAEQHPAKPRANGSADYRHGPPPGYDDEYEYASSDDDDDDDEVFKDAMHF